MVGGTLCVYIPRLEPDSRLKLLSILWAAVHYKLEACSGEHTALHGTGAGGAGTIGGSDHWGRRVLLSLRGRTGFSGD